MRILLLMPQATQRVTIRSRQGRDRTIKVFEYRKGANQFGVVVAEFTGADGALVQRQSVTFIERGAA